MALSRRCVNFLSSSYLSEEIRSNRQAYDSLGTDIGSAERGYAGGVLRGAVIPVYGGELFGWCHIGTSRLVEVSTPSDLTIIKIMEHADAQCAIVMSLDGRIGLSWSRDFLIRYSHLTHFLEATAVWSGLVGWHYADIVQSSPVEVLRRIPDCRLLPEASGEYSRWWANADYAVCAEPRLADPAVSPLANVRVMAKTADQAQTLASRLRNEVPGKRPEVTLASPGKVGDDLPDMPGRWGRLARAGENPDYIESLTRLTEN